MDVTRIHAMSWKTIVLRRGLKILVFSASLVTLLLLRGMFFGESFPIPLVVMGGETRCLNQMWGISTDFRLIGTPLRIWPSGGIKPQRLGPAAQCRAQILSDALSFGRILKANQFLAADTTLVRTPISSLTGCADFNYGYFGPTWFAQGCDTSTVLLITADNVTDRNGTVLCTIKHVISWDLYDNVGKAVVFMRNECYEEPVQTYLLGSPALRQPDTELYDVRPR